MTGRLCSVSSRNALSRCLATFMAVIAVLQLRPAHSAPADIFSVAAPAIGSDPPKASDISAGDATVSTQTGALSYSYPISAPPGRNGMSPRLALTYSSQSPLYGGIAAGWSLGIPEISEDTSQGRVKTHSPLGEATQPDPRADDRFVASGGRRLVPVTEPINGDVYRAYRAQGDSSFQRYERMASGQPYRWRVLSTDGSIMYFGGSTANCANIGDGFAPLTEHVDSFGNKITYRYESVVSDECRIASIEWGANAAAGRPIFARLEFVWDVLDSFPTCQGIYVGSQVNFRRGFKLVTGASILGKIRATAFPPGLPGSPVHTREISLTYSEDHMRCDREHAPIRFLTSIQESAWGTDAPRVDLPPVTLEYGDPKIVLTTPQLQMFQATPWQIGDLPRENLAWGYRYYRDDRSPTIEAMLVDMDGDGLLDRLVNTSTETDDGVCRATWQRNEGPSLGSTKPQFGETHDFELPRLKWHGPGVDTLPPPVNGGERADSSASRYENCSLNGQLTYFYNAGPNPGCHDGNIPGAQCHAASDPSDQELYCESGRACPPADGNSDHTYLVYRWLDANGDGLVDLVAAVHGDIDRYDIEQGNMLVGGAARPPEPLLFGTWPACPSEMDRCKEVNWDCITSANGDPNMVNQCFALAPVLGCGELVKVNYIAGGGGGSLPPVYRSPYTRCEGLYPWFIYRNRGNGVFDPPTIKYQPVPLESDVGDSNISGPGIWSQRHGIMDFDGDGFLDAVVQALPSQGDIWFVWFGDGTGGFEPRRYAFITRLAPNNQISGTATVTLSNIASSSGLLDVNGDGLQDHWSAISGQGNASVYPHIGARHADFFEVETPFLPGVYAVKPGDDTTSVVTANQGTQIFAGYTTAKNRTIDVDQDGRIDVVQIDGGSPRVFFNVGGQFAVPSVAYPNTGVPGSGDPNGFLRRTQVFDSGDGESTWELSGDLVDLDGDGLTEAAYFGANGFVRATHNSSLPTPRLLKAVHNGRGAHTSIAYTSMHDETTVVQHPGLFWFDGRPKASPENQWVVKSVTVHDDFPHLDSTTSYFYKDPRHGADDTGRYSFRGFEEVTTTSPSEARTVHRYSYSPDWSGRLIETLIYPKAQETSVTDEVRSISKSTWESRILFGGSIRSYHPVKTEQFACANGQNEAGCKATPASYTQTSVTLSAKSSTTQGGGPPLLWEETEFVLRSGTVAADGDRRTVTTSALDATATSYKLRPLATTREHRVSGSFTMFAKSAMTWDPSFRFPLTQEVWFDSNDAERAVTHFEYDPHTGNLRKRWKPKQFAANKYKEYIYDARELFVESEINELQQQQDFVYEYGTGKLVQIDGPNARGCTSDCPPTDPIYPVKERDKTRIDGLGRPIERWDTFITGSYYTLYLVETASYVDAATVIVPTSVTKRARLDSAPSSVWRESKTEIDGHGRPIKEIVLAQGSAPNDHVTSYAYRADGTLQTLSVPDPEANNASLVTYTYAFDSLGRPTSIRRPDHASPSSQSGLNLAYDGVTRIATEVVGAAGGHAAVSKAVTDAFGRVIEIHELTAEFPSIWAVTRYTYGPDDNVVTIVDPENAMVTLEHDLAGHRTKIIRQGRTWEYTYDKNGNLGSELVPGSRNPPVTDIDYTTTFVYDDLDRPLSKLIGQRSLSSADQVLFAAGAETFTWDLGTNQIGRLRHWKTYAPGSPTPAITIDTTSNSQGLRAITEHTLNIAGYPANLTRQFRQDYYVFGGIKSTLYRDYVGGSNETTSEVSYDARFMPKSMRLFRSGEPAQTLAEQTRNVAGVVTNRRTNTTGSMTFVESNWTYDKLGRITSQVVQKGPGPIQVVRQDLAYYGNDNPSSLVHFLGTSSKQLDYEYDSRHHLAKVSSTTAGYFDAKYTYGPAGRFMYADAGQTINPLPAGTQVKPRSVSYVYGDSDPERVTALSNTSDGTTYAAYTYDEPGNQTVRCYGGDDILGCVGESMEYVYDGKDQLRRATKKLNGTVQGSEEYWYDSGGGRIAIVKRDATGAKIELIWFIGDVQAHYDGTGAVTHVYSQLSLGTPVARVDRTGNPTTDVEYQFHGLASSTIAAVAQNGTLNASFSYAPFGEVIEAAGATSSGIAAHRRRFNDKYVDNVSDLAYYGARYYDQVSMTWTSADPLYRFDPARVTDEPRRAALYTFSLQNPLSYIDPDGLENIKSEWDAAKKEAETRALCKANPENKACTGKEETLAPPAKDKTHSEDEVDKLEADLDFDPNGHGEIMNALFHMSLFWNGSVKREAEMATSVEYSDQPSMGHNDEADAFRHVYVSYRLTQETSGEIAKSATDAHEVSYPNDRGERAMDLFNNQVGRRLAENPRNQSRKPSEVVREAIRKGQVMTGPMRLEGSPGADRGHYSGTVYLQRGP